ncbi:MAG: glycoside hydrolase family 5 protein [Bacteroidales bacterium]|nr:glycoside hydrolase family 5 protein [Bacteroidales bacterium]
MKKILTLLIICLAYNSLLGQVSPLSLKGTKIVDDKGDIVKLYGMSFSWHNWWGKYYNANYTSQLKNDWNCNVVRASIGVAEKNDWIKNSFYAQQCLDNVVTEAINQNLYVIIDFHSHELKLKEAIRFFGIQAKKYGKYPNVIFEIFNEPVNQTWPELKKYAEDVCKVIRKYSDNLILMGTPQWNQQLLMAVEDPIKGFDNLMYTLHFYSGTHKDGLRRILKKALDAGLPVFVSECGAMSADGRGVINESEFNIWVDLLEKYDVPIILWSIADKEETCSILKPDTDPDAHIDDSVLTEWGLMCKKFISEHNK